MKETRRRRTLLLNIKDTKIYRGGKMWKKERCIRSLYKGFLILKEKYKATKVFFEKF